MALKFERLCSVSFIVCITYVFVIEYASCEESFTMDDHDNITVTEGERVTFRCKVNNYNEIKPILWYSTNKDGREKIASDANIYDVPCRNKSNYKADTRDLGDGGMRYKYVINSSDPSIDTGMYECGYENSSSSAFVQIAFAYLTVTPKNTTENTTPQTSTLCTSFASTLEYRVTDGSDQNTSKQTNGDLDDNTVSPTTFESNIDITTSSRTRTTTPEPTSSTNPNLSSKHSTNKTEQTNKTDACTTSYWSTSRSDDGYLDRPSSIPPSQSRVAKYLYVVISVTSFIIILFVTLITVLYVKRRVEERKMIGITSRQNPSSDGSPRLREIPHITPSGSDAIYALSFKDKKARQYLSAGDIAMLEVDGNKPCSSKTMMTASCGLLNKYDQGNDDFHNRTSNRKDRDAELQFDIDTSTPPFLSDNNYETINDIQMVTRAKTLPLGSVLSESSIHPSRWSPYSNMISKLKSKVTTSGNTRRESSKGDHENRDRSDVEQTSPVDDHDYDYATVAKRNEDVRDCDSYEAIDDYLNRLPGPSRVAGGSHHGVTNKAASLQTTSAMRQGPPKPTRGKCQSQFL